MQDQASEYMTTAEVAALFRTAPSTIRYWRLAGIGPPCAKFGARWLYRHRDVLEWADAKREEATAGAR